MGLRFFGQFLIERGEIDSSQLREVLDLMERENRTLGELAVDAGFASAADCRRVNGEQRRLDRPFGELAQEMGVLYGRNAPSIMHADGPDRIAPGSWT